MEDVREGPDRVAGGDGIVLPDPGDWVCLRKYCWAVGPLLLVMVSALLVLPRLVFLGRLAAQRWARYRIRLADAPDVRGPRLTPVTDSIIRELLDHSDRDQNQLRSGLRFWDHGLRRAFIWLGDEGPLCIQWLLTAADDPALRTLGEWAEMYPPLVPTRGQVENLFAFSGARRRGFATQFAYALYDEARRAGLRELITHIGEDNVAACAWAARTGWQRYGTITRYHLDLPGLRSLSLCLHWTTGKTRSSSNSSSIPRTPP
jgi:GNAT superfamily N-acetyltransferase